MQKFIFWGIILHGCERWSLCVKTTKIILKLSKWGNEVSENIKFLEVLKKRYKIVVTKIIEERTRKDEDCNRKEVEMYLHYIYVSLNKCQF